MVLLGAQNLCLAYGGPKLLNHASFEIRSGDRVCLLGRNGSGKSSLFRILLGKEKPDTGQFEYAINLNVKGLPQEVPTDIHGSCFEIIAQGILVYHFYKIKTQLVQLVNKKVLILKMILVSILATVAILSLPILLDKNNTHFKHALEWNYFVGVILFYLFSRFFWKRTT